MLRRIFLIAASAAMLAVSALPASAAPMHMQSVTHKFAFPSLHGLKAWGTYVKTAKSVKIHVCAQDTIRGEFAAGAVAVATNANGSRQSQGGAVAIGYPETVCRNVVLHYTSHLKIYTFIAGNNGRITKRSKFKVVY